MDKKKTVLTVAAVGTGGAIVYMLYKMLIDGKSISDTIGEASDKISTFVFSSNVAEGQRLYGPLVQQVATEVGIPSSALAAIVYNESKWGAYKHNSSQCGVPCQSRYEKRLDECSVGLTQVLISTAGTLPGIDPNNLCDPYTGLKAGALYLKKLYDQFGNWQTVFAGYNAGPRRALNPPSASADYAERAVALMDKYDSQGLAGLPSLGARLTLFALRR